MYKPIFLFISLRYLWNPHLPIFKKIITILSIISISISTTALIIIISIINGSEENFKKNILSFIPHLIITNQNQCINKLEFPKNILKLSDFKKFSEFVNKEVIVQSQNNISIAEIIGIDINNYENVSNYNKKNILDILKPGQNNIILGKQLAKKININIGDKIKLILVSDKKNFKKCEYRVISTFSAHNEVDYYQILMNKKDVLNFLNYPKNYISGWRIWLKNPFSFNYKKIKQFANQFVLLDWKLQKGEFFKAMKIEKYIMMFLFFLILLVSIFNIFINFNVYIIEKKNAIAILKTQGLLNWKIILIFVILGSSTALIGTILGTIISIILIVQNNFLNYFINVFFGETNISIIIIPSQIFFINVTYILFTMISILYPAWNSVRLKPSRILSK